MQRAAGELVHFIGDRTDELGVVFDQQDRLAGSGEPAQQAQRRPGLTPVEAADRLVEQQHQRVGDEGAGQLDEAQDSGGQLAGRGRHHSLSPRRSLTSSTRSVTMPARQGPGEGPQW